MRIAITGVSGYLGTRLAAHLGKLEWVESVVGLDIRPPTASLPRLRFYHTDVLQPFGQVLADNKVDAAIHLAFVLMPHRDWAAARRVNVGGTSNFLAACAQAGVGHIIYLSSYAAYGAHSDNPPLLTESSPLRPVAGFQYSVFKAETDSLAQESTAIHSTVAVTIFRAPVILGPHCQNAVTRALFRNPMLGVKGFDPEQQFLHEDDLVEAIRLALEQRRGGIFNIAGSGTVRYSELAKLSGSRMLWLPQGLLQPLMAITWRLRLQSGGPPQALSFIKYPALMSVEKVRQELGFAARHASRQAVQAYTETQAKLVQTRRRGG